MKLTKNEIINNIKNIYEMNGKIVIRDFNNKNNLPSIKYLCKNYNICNIIDIYKFCDLHIPESKIIMSDRKPYTIDEISDIFTYNDCVLISSYLDKGVNTKVEYVCICGTKSTVIVSDFINSNTRCRACAIKINGLGKRRLLSQIHNMYISNGCILLSNYNEYLNGESILKFQCKCGNISSKSYISFSLTPHCSLCNIINAGENHYAWKGGISSIHEYCRKHITKWKNDTMRHYNYTCDITGNRFEVIHHLINFSYILNQTLNTLNLKPMTIMEYTDIELEKIKNTILELHYYYGIGVCLTKEMHDLFHKIYGTVNNTSQQYYEFKQNQLISTTIETAITYYDGEGSRVQPSGKV